MSKKPWFRWYRDTVTDIKFRHVRVKASDLAWPERNDKSEMIISLTDVIAVWAYLLESVTDDNGSVTGSNGRITGEYLSITLDIPCSHAIAIIQAMTEHGMLADDGDHIRVNNWQRRQYLDATNAERQARHREAKKSNEKRNGKVTHRQSTDTDTDTEKKETRARRASPSGFDEFWDLYPHKVGKAAALKALLAAQKRGATIEEICSGVQRYAAAKPPDRPWCNPTTFLNQDRWLDEPAPLERPETLQETAARLVRESEEKNGSALEWIESFDAGGSIEVRANSGECIPALPAPGRSRGISADDG